MGEISYRGHRVNYRLDGPPEGEVLAFVNGLTQYSELWTAYAAHFAGRGYRVLSFDLIGQGESDKPALGVGFDDHWRTLLAVLDGLGVARAHVAGISYGGTVALQFACNVPERCLSLIPMSCFAEMPPQLYQLGCGLYDALVNAGLPSMQRWLMPMNMSDEWLAANADALPVMMRRGYAINDLFALQNLMESVTGFQPITDQLKHVTCPAMILNGEFDFFTPRKCHEVLRQHLPNNRLVIVQNAYHAFTLEHPGVTMRLIAAFLEAVAEGSWTGDGSVWIAADDPEAREPWTRYQHDHLRAIVPPGAAPAKAPRARKPRVAKTGSHADEA